MFTQDHSSSYSRIARRPLERGGWGGLKSRVLCNTELLQAPSHTGFIDGLQIGQRVVSNSQAVNIGKL